MKLGDSIRALGKVREASIDAVVIRADGTREKLGRIAYWHRNPLRRWAHGLRRWLKERAHGLARSR